MNNSMFNIGESVVHPQHGVGQIVKLENREFDRGEKHTYYEISIPGGSIVWVPVDRENSGLRRLASRVEVERCRKILTSAPLPLTQDGHVRRSELVACLNRGTIVAQCEVVRDLSAFVSHKSVYGTIPAFLEAIRNVLYQEWALVEGISILDATIEISSLLKRRTELQNAGNL